MGRLTPALQFTDEDLVSLSAKAMDEMGISWSSVSLDDPGDADVPDWIDRSLGGWVFYVEESRFEEGMSRLGELMGYSPD
jgi:hypothetical protein